MRQSRKVTGRSPPPPRPPALSPPSSPSAVLVRPPARPQDENSPGPLRWNATLYAVEGSRPVPAEACPAGTAGCGACSASGGAAQCNAFRKAGNPPMMCYGGRCSTVQYDPAAPLAPAANSAQQGPSWFYGSTAAAPSGGGVAVLLRAQSALDNPEGFDLLITAYRPPAVCKQGSALARNPPGIRAGPSPFADFRGAPAVLSMDNSTGPPVEGVDYAALALGGACTNCTAGSVSQAYAAGACAPCAAGSFQPLEAATTCIQCPLGTFQAAEGATACTACPTSAPYTVLGGAAAQTACFMASVGVERVWLVGQRLGMAVVWSLDPPSHAGLADIVAVFRDSVLGQRQLAWAYTSSSGQVHPPLSLSLAPNLPPPRPPPQQVPPL